MQREYPLRFELPVGNKLFTPIFRTIDISIIGINKRLKFFLYLHISRVCSVSSPKNAV